MCGRFTLTTPASKLVEIFGLVDDFPPLPPRYNIAPTQPVAAIREQDGFRRLNMLRWGLLPFWAKSSSVGARMINARAETVATKPAFRQAFKKRRCVIPADGFYEWMRSGNEKLPYLFRLRSGEPFAFAGLWERWHNPQDDSTIDSCAIITTTPNSLVAKVHDRMPAIMSDDACALWLQTDSDPAELESLLRPWPEAEMEAVPVSKRVNNPRNDSPDILTPAEATEGPQQQPRQSRSP